MTDFVAVATQFADLGYAVFPCIPNDKKPLNEHGCLDATTSEIQISAWADTWPTANVGMSTDGLLIVDIDPLEDGSVNPWLQDDPDKLDSLNKCGAMAATPRGGRHCYFRQPAGCDYRNSAGKVAQHVDIRATGGYVVVPGSEVNGRQYRWLEGYELSSPPDRLPLPPRWLLEDLDRKSRTSTTMGQSGIAGSGEQITEGSRNARLTSAAGALRRRGFTQSVISAAIHTQNRDQCNPPLPDEEVDQIVGSVCRYSPDPVSQMLTEGPAGHGVGHSPPLKILTAGELVREFTHLRRIVIDGLLRLGEILNIIAPPKFGKSWLVLSLILAVSCGLKWLGRFFTHRGKVLLVDNELHAETLASRLPRVAAAMGLNPEDYEDNISVINLRGNLMDLNALSYELMKLEPGSYDVIVLDAWYRLQPSGSDENSNGDTTRLYNLLEVVSHRIGCSFICVHHSSKGSQTEKMWSMWGLVLVVRHVLLIVILYCDPTRRMTHSLLMQQFDPFRHTSHLYCGGTSQSSSRIRFSTRPTCGSQEVASQLDHPRTRFGRKRNRPILQRSWKPMPDIRKARPSGFCEATLAGRNSTRSTINLSPTDWCKSSQPRRGDSL